MGVQSDHRLVDLHQRYRPALMSFFLRRLRDRSEAEDLTQEVFARLALVELHGQPDGYIFQTAANLLRDRARRVKVRARHQSEIGYLDGEEVERLDPARILAAREALGEVADALDVLPERTRSMFLLFRLEGMKQAEIARLYGVSVSAVQKHLLKAVLHLGAWAEAQS
jgi:RNA polymerase sigma-70 factor (ECF subfamily)